MRLVDKAYFTLEELGERWQLNSRDLAYLAENGLLRLSIKLFGVSIERGHFEEIGGGKWTRVPLERTWFKGLLDLLERDVFRVFREGEVAVDQFAVPEPEYCHIAEPGATVLFGREDLLVRREERDRIEAKHGLVRTLAANPPLLDQINDYREVRTAGLVFHLGPVQARVVKLLAEAAGTSHPWLDGKLVLAQAGSASARMGDLFKSQSHWRRLIDSDGRGRYRLRVPEKAG